jgi:ABC-2 type transport system permease protein
MSLFYETKLIFYRSMLCSIRNPIWMVFGIFQPLCFFLLFAPLLNKLPISTGFGGSNVLVTFTPGLLIMVAMYGTSFVGFGLIDDIRSGVIERFQVTPMNRMALFLGRSLRDVVTTIVQAIFIIILALLFGLRAPFLGVLASFGFVILTAFSISIASYSAAMILRDEDTLSPAVSFVLLPAQLLAGILLPMELAPSWLQWLSFFNPFSHVVSGARALFLGSYADPSVIYGFVAVGTMACIVVYGATKLFQKTI